MISRRVAIVDSDLGRAEGLAGLLNFGNYEAHIRAPDDFPIDYERLGTLTAILVGEVPSPELDNLLEIRRNDFPSVPLITFLPSNRRLLGEHASWEIGYPLEPRQFSECIQLQVTGGLNRREPAEYSADYKNLATQIQDIAAGMSPVMIYGESARGRILVAQEIHDHSTQRDTPFMELSGYTDAEIFRRELLGFANAKGALELCDGGTLFVDNISWIDESCQAVLLGILTDHRFHGLRYSAAHASTVRLLAGSDIDLRPQVQLAEFHADLWHRLNIVSLRMPCLRKRFTDLPALVEALVGEYTTLDLKTGSLESALATIRRYGWPRNIREMAEIVEWVKLMEMHGDWSFPCSTVTDLSSFLACLELLPTDRVYRHTRQEIDRLRDQLKLIDA